jgi:heme/copper-type cytochrome/quinol oxidase subunit 2
MGAAALLEPISPELALVCPELRQQAIAALPDFTWQVFVAQTRARAAPQAPERTAGAAVEMMIWIIPVVSFAMVAFISVTLVTLAMTLIADAIR